MLIPKNIFLCKNREFYIPAATGGGDNRAFFYKNKFLNKHYKKK